jgi:hypothetical protein
MKLTEFLLAELDREVDRVPAIYGPSADEKSFG